MKLQTWNNQNIDKLGGCLLSVPTKIINVNKQARPKITHSSVQSIIIST